MRAPTSQRMSTPSTSLRRLRHHFGMASWLAVITIFILGLAGSALADMASVNQAVWKTKYGVSDTQIVDAVWLAADTDGDGVKNMDELAAGTNPFVASKTIKVSSISKVGVAVTVQFPTEDGKRYRVQTTTTLTGPVWSVPMQTPSEVIGTGATGQIGLTYVAGIYYRVVVDDKDTDSDGMSDWAEKITGYNPNSAMTDGRTLDGTALSANVALLNKVTVTATKSNATQPADALTAPVEVGAVTVSRGLAKLGTLTAANITVSLQKLGTAAEGTDYDAINSTVVFNNATVTQAVLTINPKYNILRRTNATAIVKAMPGTGYTVGTAASGSVVINAAGIANGTGLTGKYFNNSSATYSPNQTTIFGGAVQMNRTDGTVDFTSGVNGWGTATGPVGMSPASTAGAFSVRWTGQILPQYSENYFIDFRSDDSAKVWVNGVLLIDRWTTQGATEYVNTINLTAGVLYDIQIDYWNSATGSAEAKLYWWSASQPKQIIPQARLFPAPTLAQKLTAVTNNLTAVGYETVPFTMNISTPDIGGALTYALDAASSALPPGLTLNAGTGIISGTPTAAGSYNVAVNALNSTAAGAVTGSSAITFTIFPTGSVTRETLVGNTITADGTIPSLNDDTNYGNNISRRLRGYIVPPKTGNYYFWLTANNTAELWISNDSESVNRVQRATVTTGTGKLIWNTSATQKTQWLSLVAGQKYYFDVLHNTGTDADDYVQMGWCQDDIGTVPSVIGDVNPTGVTPLIPNGGAALQGYPLSGTVPSYLFQPYDYPPVTPSTGKLYAANLGPQGSAGTKASGSSNLQVNAAQTQAILHFNYQNLSSPRTGYHLHTDAFDTHPAGEIVFDIDDIDSFHPELRTADGGYIWDFTTVGTFTSIQQIRDAITQGKIYLNVHSVNFGAGEIRGNLTLVDGSQTPPDASVYPEPPTTDSFANDAQAARFLNQATFGTGPTDLAYVKTNGFTAWITNQLTKTASRTSNDVVAGLTADINAPFPTSLFTDAWWKYSITGQDQLRQRLAFALSEILVVSWNNNSGPLQNNGRVLADYFDNMVDNCLPTSGLPDSGNFRGVLKSVTLTPAMGLYLDMRANQKEDLTIGRHPNENYAREIMQLFSVGLNRAWDDGKLVLDSNAGLVPTYTQPTILGLSSLLTGWNYAQPNQASGRLPTNFGPGADYLNAMVLVPTQHDIVNPKLLLNNIVTPAATGITPRVTLTSVSQASPCVITTSTVHGLKVGDAVRISNITGGVFSSPINAMHVVTEATSATQFKVGINCTTVPTAYTNAAVTGATVTPATYTGTVIAAVTGSQADNAGTTLPHPYDQYGLTELDRAIDNICNNDNVPPYVCRQLIQRLVTSDPSPGYVYRVVQKWKNNGVGVRGDLTAVVRQILLDGEARSYATTSGNVAFGKQREPMLRLTNVARAFPAIPYTGTYTQLTGINSNKLRVVTSAPNDFSSGFTVALNFQGNYTSTVPPNPYTNPTSTNYSIGASLAIAATHLEITNVGTGAGPNTITCSQPHGMTGSGVVWFFGLSGKFSDTNINSGGKPATVTGPTTFTVGNGASSVTNVFQVQSVATGSDCVVTTAAPHGLAIGVTTTGVTINGVNGGAFTPTINSTTLSVVGIDATTFSVTGVTCSSLPTSYTIWRQSSNPVRVTTVSNHGLVNGDSVTIVSVAGGSFSPTINGTYPVSGIDGSTLNSFTLVDVSSIAPSTVNTGNIVGGNTLDVNATGMVNVTYSQAAGTNIMTVNTGGPQTNVAVPNPNSGTTTLKSKVYLKFLTRNTTAGIAGIAASTGSPAACTVTTAAPHGLTNGDSVVISGVASIGTATPSVNGTYAVTVTGTNTFTILSNYTKPSIASISTGNPCTVTTSGDHGLTTGNSVTISGVSGGTFTPAINATFTVTVVNTTQFTVASNCTVVPTNAPAVTAANLGTLAADGAYSVDTTNGTTSFTVLTTDTPASARNGSVIVPKISTSYTPVSSNNVVQYNCNVNHNMQTGDHFWADVPVVGSPVTDAEYVVSAPIIGSGIAAVDEDHLQTSYLPVTSSLSTTFPKPSGSNNGITIYPLQLRPDMFTRSGNVTINQSTFNLGSTEGSLTQSPLNAPTVFNYFFPDYKFPGTLANNGIDSPEFQLTTDTNISNLTNSLTNLIIGTGGGNGNLNGLSSFNNGGGSVVLDIGSYMTLPKTIDSGINGLITELANVLVGAPLETATQTTIKNFVAGKAITAIATGSPCIITVPSHGLANGNSITIYGVSGGTFTPAINATYTVSNVTANTFTVGVNFSNSTGLVLTGAAIGNFPMNYPTTPSNLQMRDRVRAIIHLIITSAEYAVQK